MILSKLEKTELKGIGLSRGVFLEDKALKPDEGKAFDWGYHSDSSRHLAYRIMQELKIEDLSLVSEFVDVFICALPPTNFSVLLEVRKWLHWHKVPWEPKYRKRTAMALMHIKYKPLDPNLPEILISKYLDLPNLGVKNAIFRNDTIEYKLLMHLIEGNTDSGELVCNSKLNSICAYYKRFTSTPDPNNMKIKKHARFFYESAIDAFIFNGGLGSNKDYEGYKHEEYDYSIVE